MAATELAIMCRMKTDFASGIIRRQPFFLVVLYIMRERKKEIIIVSDPL